MDLKKEIEELKFEVEKYKLISTELVTLILKIKVGDLNIDEVIENIKKDMDKKTFEILEHTYLNKDMLGHTSNLLNELDDNTFKEDDTI